MKYIYSDDSIPMGNTWSLVLKNIYKFMWRICLQKPIMQVWKKKKKRPPSHNTKICLFNDTSLIIYLKELQTNSSCNSNFLCAGRKITQNWMWILFTKWNCSINAFKGRRSHLQSQNVRLDTNNAM